MLANIFFMWRKIKINLSYPPNGSTQRLSRWWDISGISFTGWCPLWDISGKIVWLAKTSFFNFMHNLNSNYSLFQFWDVVVVSSFILRHLYTLLVCRRLLKCVAHSKSQELNDELSVQSQITAWLPLVCIKSQQGEKMAAPPKQKFCANPHSLIPPPTVLCVSLQSCVPDNWASWLPLLCCSTAPFTQLPLNFSTLRFKTNKL